MWTFLIISSWTVSENINEEEKITVQLGTDAIIEKCIIGTDSVRKSGNVKSWDYNSSDNEEDVSLSLAGSRCVSLGLIRP